MPTRIRNTAKSAAARQLIGEQQTHSDPLTVLVVDDDADFRRLCRAHLQRAKYQVLEAENGMVALARVAEEHVDVVIMDIMMPEMDGLECTRRLRSEAATKSIPIIMSSGRTHADDIVAGLEAGANDYLTKPINHHELLLRVHNMATLHRSRIKLLYEQEQLARANEVRGEQARAMSILFELSRALAASAKTTDVLEHVLSATAELVSCRRVSIMLPDDNGQLTIVGALGIDDDIIAEIQVRRGVGIAGKVFATGKSTVVNRDQDVTRPNPRYESDFYASAPLVCKTITAAGRVQGVLNVTERYGGQPFDTRELEYLEIVCNMTALALEQMRNQEAKDQAQKAIVIGMAALAEYRDTDTGTHLKRVTEYALTLARELRTANAFANVIDDPFLDDLEQAMPLHDIGKVAVPDAILLKPGKLTDEEFAIMEGHTTLGAQVIQSVIDNVIGAGFLRMTKEIALSHHERFDGSGYPAGLAGEEIPLPARIAAVADVYDALRSKRPYKAAFEHDQAIKIIRQETGSHFDPAIVTAFLKREQDFAELALELGDSAKPSAQYAPAGGQVADTARAV